MTTWPEAVKSALARYSTRHNTVQIERKLFLEQELSRMVAETNSFGSTPGQTVSRELQSLRGQGILYFSDRGMYVLNQQSINTAREDLPDDVLENAVKTDRLVFPDVETSDYLGSARIRRGMGALRKICLRNYDFSCALCDVRDEKLLVTSHIARWADRAEARGLLSNTISFCTLHDKLFETGYFSISDEYKILWKEPVTSSAINTWKERCTSAYRLPNQQLPSPQWLALHRYRVGLQANNTL